MKHERDDLADDRYRSLQRWRERWTLLIYILGVATTVFLIAAISLFINESWLPGALSTVASILSGAAVAWLLERRREAVAEEDQANQERKHDLKDEQDKQRSEQSRTALLGRKNIEGS